MPHAHPLNLRTPALVYFIFGMSGILRVIADQQTINVAQTQQHLLAVSAFTYFLNYIGHKYNDTRAWVFWLGVEALPLMLLVVVFVASVIWNLINEWTS